MKNGGYIYNNLRSLHDRTMHLGGVIMGNLRSVDHSKAYIEALMRTPKGTLKKDIKYFNSF